MSLLYDHGHTFAHRYPLGMLSEEAEIVGDRWKKAEVARTILLHSAVAALLSEKAHRNFRDIIEEMNG